MQPFVKDFRRLCQNCNLRIHRNILKRTFLKKKFKCFSDNEWKSLQVLLKIRLQFCQKCAKRFYSKLFRINVFFEALFFNIFEHRVEKFKSPVNHFWEGLSKLHFTSSWEPSEKNFFEKVSKLIFFGMWSETMGHGSQNCNPPVLDEMILRNKKFRKKFFFIISRRWANKIGILLMFFQRGIPNPTIRFHRMFLMIIDFFKKATLF